MLRCQGQTDQSTSMGCHEVDCLWGGKLGLLNCWGSSAQAYRENFHKLVRLDITGFYPGHQLFAVADGQRHLDAAAEALAGVYMPESF